MTLTSGFMENETLPDRVRRFAARLDKVECVSLPAAVVPAPTGGRNRLRRGGPSFIPAALRATK